jgi:hypothetical protein
MSVEIVGNPLGNSVPLLYTREYTLVKALMNVENVANPLSEEVT